MSTGISAIPATFSADDVSSWSDDVDVVELHDCFSANELITYEALGLAAEGEGHKLVEEEADARLDQDDVTSTGANAADFTVFSGKPLIGRVDFHTRVEHIGAEQRS